MAGSGDIQPSGLINSWTAPVELCYIVASFTNCQSNNCSEKPLTYKDAIKLIIDWKKTNSREYWFSELNARIKEISELSNESKQKTKDKILDDIDRKFAVNYIEYCSSHFKKAITREINNHKIAIIKMGSNADWKQGENSEVYQHDKDNIEDTTKKGYRTSDKVEWGNREEPPYLWTGAAPTCVLVAVAAYNNSSTLLKYGLAHWDSGTDVPQQSRHLINAVKAKNTAKIKLWVASADGSTPMGSVENKKNRSLYRWVINSLKQISNEEKVNKIEIECIWRSSNLSTPSMLIKPTKGKKLFVYWFK